MRRWQRSGSFHADEPLFRREFRVKDALSRLGPSKPIVRLQQHLFHALDAENRAFQGFRLDHVFAQRFRPRHKLRIGDGFGKVIQNQDRLARLLYQAGFRLNRRQQILAV